MLQKTPCQGVWGSQGSYRSSAPAPTVRCTALGRCTLYRRRLASSQTREAGSTGNPARLPAALPRGQSPSGGPTWCSGSLDQSEGPQGCPLLMRRTQISEYWCQRWGSSETLRSHDSCAVPGQDKGTVRVFLMTGKSPYTLGHHRTSTNRHNPNLPTAPSGRNLA